MRTYMNTREDAQKADAAERQHRRDCIPCTVAARSRKPDARCAEGARLAKAKREADDCLRRERELDKLPNPDQEPLFTPEESGRIDPAGGAGNAA